MTDFRYRYDETTGIIHCNGSGFWSVEAVQQSGESIQEVMRRSRRAFGNIAVLVISDEAPQVQSPEVMETTKRRMQAWGPKDRIAIVMSSALVSMQAKRFLVSDNFRIFSSKSEALAWLTAERAAMASDLPRQAKG